VEYAQGQVSRWTDEDRHTLERSFDTYLDREFDSELADTGTEEELEGLRARLGDIGDYCGTDVQIYRDQIEQRIGDLHSDDDDSPPVRQWQGTNEPMSEHQQEAEVRRLLMDCRTARMPSSRRRRPGSLYG